MSSQNQSDQPSKEQTAKSAVNFLNQGETSLARDSSNSRATGEKAINSTGTKASNAENRSEADSASMSMKTPDSHVVDPPRGTVHEVSKDNHILLDSIGKFSSVEYTASHLASVTSDDYGFYSM